MNPLPWDAPNTLQGVDVSGIGQPYPLPWHDIRKAGATFASIKASDALSPSSGFLMHLDGALGSGFDVGAYSFLHSNIDGQAQAETLSRVLDAYPNHALKMRESLDWEDAKRVDPKNGGAGPALALSHALCFLRTIHRLRGRPPIVYTYPGFMDLFRSLFGDPRYEDSITELGTYDLWISHFRWDPITGHDYNLKAPRIPGPWTLAKAWQTQGNKGPLIAGKQLDRDVFFGNKSGWDTFCSE